MTHTWIDACRTKASFSHAHLNWVLHQALRAEPPIENRRSASLQRINSARPKTRTVNISFGKYRDDGESQEESYPGSGTRPETVREWSGGIVDALAVKSKPLSCDPRLVPIIRGMLKGVVGKTLTMNYTFRSRIPSQGNHLANGG